MWHCPTCDRLILEDKAGCPNCGLQRASSLPAVADSSRKSSTDEDNTPQVYTLDGLILSASVAAGFLLLGILLILASPSEGEFVPMGVGCMFCSLTALVCTAILHSLQTPAVSDQEVAKIRGRYSHPYVPPSNAVYNSIIDLAKYAPRPLRSFMPYRPWFRAAIKERPIPGLMLCMIDKDPRIQELAIFMLGLCKRRGLESDFMEFRHSTHRFLRKRAIKALRRLAAWHLLVQVARDEIDPQLHALATFRRASFGSRLERLQRSLSATEVEPAETPLRILVPLPLKPCGPKPAWRIRLVLDRIRALLSGAKSPQ